MRKFLDINNDLGKLLLNSLPGVFYRSINYQERSLTSICTNFFKITGYSTEELLENDKVDFFHFIHPDDKHLLVNNYSKFSLNSKCLNIIYRIICKNGEIKWVRDTANNVFEDSGSFKYIEGYIEEFKLDEIDGQGEVLKSSLNRLSDIVKINEELVFKGEEKFKQIFDTINDVYYQLDLNKNITMVSPSVFNSTGFKPEELIGKSMFDLYENKNGSIDLIPILLKEGKVNGVEANLITKDNRRIETSSNISLFYDSNKNPIGVHGIIRDVTEKNIQTEKLNNALKLNEQIINSTDQLFYVLKIVDKYSLINPAIYVSANSINFCGVSKKDFTQNPELWFDLIHPDDLLKVGDCFKTMFITKSAFSVVYRVRKVGEVDYIWVEDFVFPIINEIDEIEEVYGSVKDVTRLKSKEFELEKVINELLNRNNELMQFSYIISHNIKNPIANIIGLSEILNYPGLSEEEKKQIFIHIKESILKINSLVNDLNLILTTRSDVNSKKENINLTELSKEIFNVLENQINESKSVIKFDFDNDANELYSIKIYIESILYNLISNAIKYKSLVRLPEISVKSRKKDDTIIIVVKDNGAGINLNLYGKNVFGLYKRFHEGIEGKGLGLHMTKTQVELLGGSISIESDLEIGTTFTVILPLKN